jgi:hypothetical protein
MFNSVLPYHEIYTDDHELNDFESIDFMKNSEFLNLSNKD